MARTSSKEDQAYGDEKSRNRFGVLGPDICRGAQQRPAEADMPTSESPSRWGLTFFAMTSNAAKSPRFRPKTAFGKKMLKISRHRRRWERPTPQRKFALLRQMTCGRGECLEVKLRRVIASMPVIVSRQPGCLQSPDAGLRSSIWPRPWTDLAGPIIRKKPRWKRTGRQKAGWKPCSPLAGATGPDVVQRFAEIASPRMTSPWMRLWIAPSLAMTAGDKTNG